MAKLLLPLHNKAIRDPKKCFRFNSRVKHLVHCSVFMVVIIFFTAQLAHSKDNQIDIDPFTEYGRVLACLLYFLRFLTLIALPQCVSHFLGLTMFNAFTKKVKLKVIPSKAPFICLRTVTRGDYPDLVRHNVQRNMKTCLAVGLENFIIEVVTDKVVNLEKHPRVRELVVPPDYKTKTGALYKARALQYCLEDETNILSDNDYIVHLDEETLVTEDSMRGIINFASSGNHQFGQGLITYSNGNIVNWFTTLADSFRVSDDMGKLRFTLKVFHRPIFGWKGSYVVSKLKAEKDVSYDHGLDGSVAEDCYFSMIAFAKGYSFDFIEGEMWEKSPFTVKDFIQQRKRWLQGIFLVVHSPKIPLKYKFLLGMLLYSWMTMPLTTSNLLFAMLYPLPKHEFLIFNSMVAFTGAVNVYMCIFGVIKSFTLLRLGIKRFILCLIGALLTIPFNIVIENIAVIWGFFGNKYHFYVVQKQVMLNPV